MQHRGLATFLIICMVLTFAPLSAMAATTLQYGDQGASVKTLQSQLNQLGYDCGTPDGIFGQRTRDAVKALQRAHGLTADGIVGSRTRSKINSLLGNVGNTGGTGSSVLKYGSRGSAVKSLQQDLNTLGYNCGAPDGIFGSGTASAVKAFQRACSLGVDGIAGRNTLSKIEELIDTGASQGDPPSSPSTPGPTLLKYGSRGDSVRDLQGALNALGYDCGTPDGIFGGRTVSAVKAFQRDHGLSADGIAGRRTLNAINGAEPSGNDNPAPADYAMLKKGSRGSDVKSLQQRLNDLGYGCGVADGIYGSGTEEAVRRFQGVNGLTTDGIAGPVTQAKLYGSGAKQNDGSGDVDSDFTLTRTLKKGSIGTDVKTVQKRLNQLGFDCGAPDGVYGSGTMRAAMGYQLTRGLAPDGFVGPETANKMFGGNGGTKVMDLPAYDLTESYDAPPDYDGWKPDAGKINMVWHGNMGHVIATDAINVVAPVWYSICLQNGKTRVNTSNHDQAYINGARAAGYKVWVTVQSFTSGYSKLVVSNKECQDQVIADMAAAVDSYGLDGINFDFENMDPADKGLYTAFVARAAKALHQHGAVVAVDITKKKDANNWWTSCYDRAGLGQVADYICLMTYDQYTDSPGPCASIGWVESAVQVTLTEVPADKLLMGIPLYGYDWIDGSRKALTLEDFSNLANRGSITLLSGDTWQVSRWITPPSWRDSTGTNYFKFKDQYGRTHESWYESDETIRLKLDLINKYDLAGACSWRYGFSVGREAVWDCYREKLNP